MSAPSNLYAVLGEEPMKVLRDVLQRLADKISTNIEANGQRASGRTQASLAVEVDADGGELVGRSPFGTLETGRAGGRVPYNFRDIIKQWIIDKGLAVEEVPYKRVPTMNWQPKYTPYERGLNQMAGAIANRIAEDGTLLYREGGRADVYSNEIPAALEEVANRIGILLVDYVNTIKLNSIEIS